MHDRLLQPYKSAEALRSSHMKKATADDAPYTACVTGCLKQSFAGTPEWPTPASPIIP